MIPFDIEITSGFRVATYPAGATFGPRPTQDFELVWMIEGDAEYILANTDLLTTLFRQLLSDYSDAPVSTTARLLALSATGGVRWRR